MITHGADAVLPALPGSTRIASPRTRSRCAQPPTVGHRTAPNPHCAARAQHPDKNTGDDEATKKFQALSWVHAFLADARKRAAYDASGDYVAVDEDDGPGDAETFDVWYGYWRDMFPALDEAKIAAFEAEYRGSEEEAGDVVRAYEAAAGALRSAREAAEGRVVSTGGGGCVCWPRCAYARAAADVAVRVSGSRRRRHIIPRPDYCQGRDSTRLHGRHHHCLRITAPPHPLPRPACHAARSQATWTSCSTP